MSQPTPQPGTVIGGKYRIERVLGEGGMGVVMAAANVDTGKRVAIKWMHPELARNPDAAQRFRREAIASARVQHPNVVDVYDVLTEQDALFMVMQLLEGEPLSALMERGTTSLPELISLLLCAMRGVAAAHRQGIIHRDIKPDNIFLAREGDTRQPVPKVLDFGISKLSGLKDQALTKTGMALGTPLYMSVEQLSGVKDIDARTDVYAFGVILYQAVTGQPPFMADTFPVLIAKIMTEQAQPPKALRPDIPTALSRLIEWAMAKDRNDRIGSMEELIQELEPFASDLGFRGQLTVAASAIPRVSTPNQRPPSAASTTDVPSMPPPAFSDAPPPPSSTVPPPSSTVPPSAPPYAAPFFSTLDANASTHTPSMALDDTQSAGTTRGGHMPIVIVALIAVALIGGWWILRSESSTVAREEAPHVVSPAEPTIAKDNAAPAPAPATPTPTELAPTLPTPTAAAAAMPEPTATSSAEPAAATTHAQSAAATSMSSDPSSPARRARKQSATRTDAVKQQAPEPAAADSTLVPPPATKQFRSGFRAQDF